MKNVNLPDYVPELPSNKELEKMTLAAINQPMPQHFIRHSYDLMRLEKTNQTYAVFGHTAFDISDFDQCDENGIICRRKIFVRQQVIAKCSDFDLENTEILMLIYIKNPDIPDPKWRVDFCPVDKISTIKLRNRF